jgi:hypothetical protein
MEVAAITNYFQPMEKKFQETQKMEDTDSKSNSGKKLDKL